MDEKTFDTSIMNIMYGLADNMRDSNGKPYFTYNTKMKIRFRYETDKSYNIITNLSEWCWLFYQGVENLHEIYDNPISLIKNLYVLMGFGLPYYKDFSLYNYKNIPCTLKFENKSYNLNSLSQEDKNNFDDLFTSKIINILDTNTFYIMELSQYATTEEGENYGHRNTLIVQRMDNDYYFTIYEPHGALKQDLRHYSCGSLFLNKLSESFRRLGKNPKAIDRTSSCANIGIQSEIDENSYIKEGYCVMYNYLFLYILFSLVRDGILDNLPMNVWIKRMDEVMVSYIRDYFKDPRERINYILGFTYMLIGTLLQMTSFNIKPDLAQKIYLTEEKYTTIFNRRKEEINNANLTERQKYDLLVNERLLYNKRVNKIKEPIIKESERQNMIIDRILLKIFKEDRNPDDKELKTIQTGSFSGMVKLNIIYILLIKKNTSFYIEEEDIKVPKNCIVDGECPSDLGCINNKCLGYKVLEEECEDKDQCIEGSCVWIKEESRNICKDNDIVENKSLRFWPGYISYFGSFLRS